MYSVSHESAYSNSQLNNDNGIHERLRVMITYTSSVFISGAVSCWDLVAQLTVLNVLNYVARSLKYLHVLPSSYIDSSERCRFES